MTILKLEDLHVSINQKPILKGVDLSLNKGSVQVIMGPNGSGKTTLANVLAGQPGYTVTKGTINYEGEDLLALSPDQRAHRGVFLSFQYPVEIPGVSTIYFLKTALNAIRQARHQPALDAIEFLNYVKNKLSIVGLDQSFLYRSINEGFSGGKKRSEILQMAVLEPTLAILDETDSGLDIDSLKTIAQGINQLRSSSRTLLIITHYQRLLNYIEPDQIHILYEGKIVRSGNAKLALELEKKGYEKIIT